KKPSRWLGIMRDITEQRKTQDQILKSEDKFRTIFNASKDGIILLDEDLKILDVNKSLVIKTAYTRQNYIGANSLDFLTTKTAEDTIKWLANLKRSQSVENLETELKNSTNTFVPVEISASKITINNKNALLLIIRDISERKKLESKLLKSVINTEERERLRFSQELHDELGPLLSAAKMYVDWLDKPNANISKEELIPDIKTLLEEASQSIRNISFKLSPHILQNYGILEALKAFIGKIKEVTKLEINITAPEIPRFAEISETVVYRVLCECINNTIKHAKAKSVNIIFAKSSDQLAVNYSDDGIGFDLEKVMSKPKGIGLLNMQSRLKSINGELHIDASPGHGTNIFLKINTD
ncbi:MAG TPA: PAS domain-containing sensor histidine kinase, partial [Bacteroidales bacterium]|nr:PAS domain-containing sensor histidine kinase [Bacteroidales bacterium]